MNTAQELETAHAREPVRLIAKDNGGNGVLALAGRKTSLKISTTQHLSDRDARTGWFDLVVEQNNGNRILLHNAIAHSSVMPHRDRREWEFDVFPNIIVFNADPVVTKDEASAWSPPCRPMNHHFDPLETPDESEHLGTRITLRKAVLAEDCMRDLVRPLHDAGWSTVVSEPDDEALFMTVTASRGEKQINVALLFTCGSANSLYHSLAERCDVILYRGAPV